MKLRRLALVTTVGFACFAFFLLLQVSAPTAETRKAQAPVTAVVRTDLGELKWVATEATDYTPLEAAGRQLFLKDGCTYCHSQYYRPVKEELRPWGYVSANARRWGPAVEPGEYAYDDPLTFGTRGIAPDLSRTGLKYGDEWHLAHFWNPPMVRPGSIMGGFSGLYDAPATRVKIVDDGAGGKTLERNAITEKFFDFDSKAQVKLTPNPTGLMFVPMSARGKTPIVWTPNDEFTGDNVRLAAETDAISALTAYVQKLGTNRGKWREVYEPDDIIDPTKPAEPRSDAQIARGQAVFEKNCIGCHGVKGDGNGMAATFTYKQRPRNFTLGVFKFRLTKATLPTDADLLRTISRGVRGTAMPPWFDLPLQDRLAVIQYVKYVLTVDKSDPQKPYYYFVEEPPGAPLQIGTPPKPTAELVAHGQEIWKQAKCWECHGLSGKGDGTKAAGLKDDWGFPIVPANLSRGLFKSGPSVKDIYRTISTGLSGTPMASFRDAFPDADRWALAYYILSLSAYSDPRTGEPLPIPRAARAALDDPEFQTAGPDRAYGGQVSATGAAP